jgi:spermidine synthase
VTPPRQFQDPDVRLVEEDGEVTLYVGGGQAMQGWEADLMEASADLLCEFGTDFLEAGLGLGLSALRIAGDPGTRRHVVVERNAPVIALFRERHPDPPAALEIVHDDFFAHVGGLAPASLDGIFFDPYLGSSEVWAEPDLWQEVVPQMIRALRPGGALMPCFTEQPVLRPEFMPYFERVIVERRPFRAYASTAYTAAPAGDAYIQCFVNGRS